MLAQRPPGAAPAVRARAEALPFGDAAFDAAMAILTVHHWDDRRRGLGECARVARDRVVCLTWDPDSAGFWLVQDYFPDILDADRLAFPGLAELRAALRPFEVREVRPLPVPADCADGFLGAYWRRPAAYLDAEVRAGMSAFARVRDAEGRLAWLAADLESGRWAARHGQLAGLASLDVGYRLVTAAR
jgi:SAM-dependent methyltransferase